MWTVITLVVAWSLFPFWWGFVYSFKPPAHLY
jgi:ABC-type glycerol-3-phosphate transport system permease component